MAWETLPSTILGVWPAHHGPPGRHREGQVSWDGNGLTHISISSPYTFYPRSLEDTFPYFHAISSARLHKACLFKASSAVRCPQSGDLSQPHVTLASWEPMALFWPSEVPEHT